ncbi:glycosyltransferase [Gynuella sp.]|uniref:glycosyltransferase n=1 Tax=Gynuella sp. TaxID=2969146 RepID=UPI003D0B9048
MLFNTALLIGKNWPESRSSAAGTRTLQILSDLQSCSHNVHFASAAKAGEFSDALPGIHCSDIEMNSESFDQWLIQLNPDIVIFDRFMTEEQFSWRVRQQCPDAIRVLDTSDIHSLRHMREQTHKSSQPTSLNNDIAFREIAAILRSDLTLIISDYEIAWLQSQFQLSKALLLHLPFAAQSLPASELPSYQQRHHICFIGGFLHAPNIDAVEWLYQDIWPLISSQIPDVECHIYGAYIPARIQQLHQPSKRFLVKGRMDSIDHGLPTYRINLAPLRFGAGNKGKVIDGFRTGTPNILTAIAAEGMNGDQTWELPPADTAAVFARQILDVYQHPELWQRVQQQGYEVLRAVNLPENLNSRLVQRLASVKQHLTTIREQNFYGNLLWQAQFRATEFMGRWIEAKNRNKS